MLGPLVHSPSLAAASGPVRGPVMFCSAGTELWCNSAAYKDETVTGFAFSIFRNTPGQSVVTTISA